MGGGGVSTSPTADPHMCPRSSEGAGTGRQLGVSAPCPHSPCDGGAVPPQRTPVRTRRSSGAASRSAMGAWGGGGRHGRWSRDPQLHLSQGHPQLLPKRSPRPLNTPRALPRTPPSAPASPADPDPPSGHKPPRTVRARRRRTGPEEPSAVTSRGVGWGVTRGVTLTLACPGSGLGPRATGPPDHRPDRAGGGSGEGGVGGFWGLGGVPRTAAAAQ